MKQQLLVTAVLSIFALTAHSFDYVTDQWGDIVEDKYGDPIEEYGGNLYYGGTAIKIPDSEPIYYGGSAMKIPDEGNIYWRDSAIKVDR